VSLVPFNGSPESLLNGQASDVGIMVPDLALILTAERLLLAKKAPTQVGGLGLLPAKPVAR
jgi:hypothetical protein